MKLEEYLEKLKICPDDKLLEDFGIGDDWGMLLKAKFEDVCAWFNQSDMYKFLEASEGEYSGTEVHKFNYVPGTVWLQVCGWLRGDCTASRYIVVGDGSMGCDNVKPDVHREKQIKNYNMSLILHTCQGEKYSDLPRIPGKKIEGVTDERAIALVVDDICRFAIDTSTPICFSAVNRADACYEASSKIIYFPREPEINETTSDKTEEQK